MQHYSRSVSLNQTRRGLKALAVPHQDVDDTLPDYAWECGHIPPAYRVGRATIPVLVARATVIHLWDDGYAETETTIAWGLSVRDLCRRAWHSVDDRGAYDLYVVDFE